MSNQMESRKRRLELQNLEAKILQTVQLQRCRDLGLFLGHVITVEKSINVLLREMEQNGTPVAAGIAKRTLKAISSMSGIELGKLGREEMEEDFGGRISKRYLDVYSEGLEKGREGAKEVILETGKEE